MISYYASYIRVVLRHPILLVILCLLTLALSFPASSIQLSNNMEEWFPASSPQLQAKRQFIQHFGNDELIFLLLTFPDSTLEENRIHHLDSLVKGLENIEGIDQVFCRNKTRNIQGGLGLKDRVKKLEHLFFQGRNREVEMVYIRPDILDNFDSFRPVLIGEINEVRAQIPSYVQSDITGSGVIFSIIEEESNREAVLLFGLCFLLVFIVLGLRLRDLRMMILALAVFVLVFLLAVSLIGWLGLAISLITMVVPILFVINFFAYILHFMEGYAGKIEEHLAEKLLPIIYSAITSMIGFSSLMLSDIQIIQQFGLLTAGGIGLGLLGFLLVGIPLLFWKMTILPSRQRSSIMESYFNSLTKRNVIPLIILVGIFMAISVWSASFIEVDTNSVKFLPESHPARVSTAYIEKEFGSFNTVDFYVRKKDSSKLTAKDFKLLKKTEARIAELAVVKGLVSWNSWRSIVRTVSLMDKQIAEELEANYLSEDGKFSRLSLRIPLGSVSEMEGNLRLIEGAIDDMLSQEKLELSAVGYLPIYIEHVNLIVKGMFESLGLALICIVLVMILMVRNWKLGLLAMIPNTFPLFGIAFFMNLTGFTLDIASSIIASLIIGLVVDDTLHIIWAAKKSLDQHKEIRLKEIMRHILRPSSSTTLMFILGFSVLMLSTIKSLNNFGWLLVLGLGLGWIGDFILFPAFLKILPSKREENF
ncbi:MAG: hypothetical protein AAFY71_14235 [Bacteroidota bacterium]